MRLGEKFYSKNLKRTIYPGEEIYLEELKKSIEERVSFFKNAGCGASGCNPKELQLKNELISVHTLIQQIES